MCYSAMVMSNWKAFLRHAGVYLSLREFRDLMERRLTEPTAIRLPRGFDLEFAHPESPEEEAIKTLSDRYRAGQTTKLETEIFTQRRRQADAERKLAVKVTKAATESQRIAAKKVTQSLEKLALLKDDRPHPDDYRIFPRSYAPIVIVRDGRKVMVPARYLLSQPGAPPSMDDALSGNYNARRDNLTRFWRNQFGTTHALLVIDSFFENVTGADGKNQILRFNPRPAGQMFIACLFAQWMDAKSGETLISFATITDEPPPEVAAAGHDRMIINLQPENVDRWLNPAGRSQEELQAILSDRQMPYYEHRLAA